MPTIRTISARTPVNADQQTVFDAVTNWELQSKWIFATKVSGVGDYSHTLGGKLQAFTGFGKFGFLDTMTITKWESPIVCEVTHTGNIVKGSGLFEVGVEKGTTYFTWTEYTEIPFGNVGKAGWFAASPLIRLGMKFSLRRFRRIF